MFNLLESFVRNRLCREVPPFILPPLTLSRCIHILQLIFALLKSPPPLQLLPLTGNPLSKPTKSKFTPAQRQSVTTYHGRIVGVLISRYGTCFVIQPALHVCYFVRNCGNKTKCFRSDAVIHLRPTDAPRCANEMYHRHHPQTSTNLVSYSICVTYTE